MYTLLHSRKNSVKSCFSLSFYSLCDLWYSFHYMVLMFSFFNCDLPKILFFFLDLCFIFYTVLLKPNRMSSLEQSNSTDQIFMEITFPLIFVFTVERHGDLIWIEKENICLSFIDLKGHVWKNWTKICLKKTKQCRLVTVTTWRVLMQWGCWLNFLAK